jgi:hypothetical protein
MLVNADFSIFDPRYLINGSNYSREILFVCRAAHCQQMLRNRIVLVVPEYSTEACKQAITDPHIWQSEIEIKAMSPGLFFRNVHALKRTETHLFRSGDFSVGLVAVERNRRNRRIRTKCHFPLVAKFLSFVVSRIFCEHRRRRSLCTSSEKILTITFKSAERCRCKVGESGDLSLS